MIIYGVAYVWYPWCEGLKLGDKLVRNMRYPPNKNQAALASSLEA